MAADGARRIAVAYSGGRDSTALLHATLVEAEPLGVHVLALHVHHGLSDHADAWLQHCDDQCARWRRAGRPVSFHSTRLTGRPAQGDSIEAWARTERYAALRTMARAGDADLVLLAQHRRDQAETVLLQLLRGAGTAGLAAMPVAAERDGIVWRRPWLDQPREAIEAYLRSHRLGFVDDDSNVDPRHERNRLRLQVWPALTDAFPDGEAALCASAGWAQEADAALRELARLDLAQVADAAGLRVGAWCGLSRARRGNALRTWLVDATGRVAPATLTRRLLDELPACAAARWPLDGAELRLYRGRLTSSFVAPTSGASPAPESELSIRRAGLYRLPGWRGALRVERVREGGVPFEALATLELRERAGAERFQAGPGRPPRSLKKQFQQAGVPAWERDGPLVLVEGRLIFVPGLGIDARAVGVSGQRLASLRWVAQGRD